MLFFVISLMFYLLQNFSNKHFSCAIKRSGWSVTLVQNWLCVLSAAIILAVSGNMQIMPLAVMMLAALFGVLYLLTVFLLLKAFTLGPMGSSTLMCNIGMFISAVYGIVRFGDDFTLYIGVGAILLLGAVILSTPNAKAEANGGFVWFALALASGLSNGAVASVKREAVAAYSGGSQIFLFWGFLFAALSSTILLLFTNVGRREVRIILKQPKLVLSGILAGVGTAGANLFQMLALTCLSSAVLYPLTSGFLVVSLWFASYLIYRETRLTWKNCFSVVLCVAAIIIFNL